MKILVIETSCSESFVMLHTSEKTEVKHLPQKGQATVLIPEIDTLLSSLNLRLKDLDCIAVGNGPGAFTGTRIGVVTAKTLSFASGIPLIPFCSLVRYLPQEEGPFTLIGDAKSKGSYHLKGNKTAEGITFEMPPALVKDKSSPPSSVTNYQELLFLLKNKFAKNETMTPEELEVQYLFSP